MTTTTGLGAEARQVQNAALGAYLQWRFACAYAGNSRVASPCPLHLVFLVLPLLFNAASLELIEGTRAASGLRAFAIKFSERKNDADLLVAVHLRIRVMRELSLQALQMSFGAKLLAADISTAGVFPLSMTDAMGLSPSVRALSKAAEKLGVWCSELSIHEICEILKVRL